MKLIVRIILAVVGVAILYSASAQQVKTVNAILIKNNFEPYKYQPPAHRKIMSLKNRRVVARLNPLLYVSAGLLFFYQRVLSEQIQANCMYETTCSSYTKLSIERYGLIKGTLLGVHQLNTCFPKVIDDYKRHKISGSQKVINEIGK